MEDFLEKNAAPAIILVGAQLGENIGTVARAMLNFGLTDLRLVNPRAGWQIDRARKAASGAEALIDNHRLYNSVAAGDGRSWLSRGDHGADSRYGKTCHDTSAYGR